MRLLIFAMVILFGAVSDARAEDKLFRNGDWGVSLRYDEELFEPVPPDHQNSLLLLMSTDGSSANWELGLVRLKSGTVIPDNKIHEILSRTYTGKSAERNFSGFEIDNVDRIVRNGQPIVEANLRFKTPKTPPPTIIQGVEAIQYATWHRYMLFQLTCTHSLNIGFLKRALLRRNLYQMMDSIRFEK